MARPRAGADRIVCACRSFELWSDVKAAFWDEDFTIRERRSDNAVAGPSDEGGEGLRTVGPATQLMRESPAVTRVFDVANTHSADMRRQSPR